MSGAITGDKVISRKLTSLRKSAAKRAIQKGLNKGAQLGAKAVKQSVPSKYKTARKAIGWRAVKRSQTGGEPVAKVGSAVGRRRSANMESRMAGSGVGISTRNMHWFFLGTSLRYHKNGKGTGKITSGFIRPVAETLQQHKFSIAGAIKRATLVAIDKEVAKIK